MTIVQQNYLLAIGALILILIVVALVLRGRRKSTAEATAQVAEERDAMIDSPAEPREPVARSARKKCPSCGKAMLPNDAFCDRCGRPLR
jgi:predicted nucleic acid-binding Zn ribbon protein